MTSFNEQLKALRKQNGLTLLWLSELTGLSISFLSDMENGRGKPSLETLYTLADALKTDINTLTGYEGANMPPDTRVSNALRVLDVDSLSPLEALTRLYELKRLVTHG